MDIACVILGIIDLCKPSMPLSIVTTCVGVLEFTLLASVNSAKKAQKKQKKQKKPEELREKLNESLEESKQKTSDSFVISVALFAVIVGVVRICTM